MQAMDPCGEIGAGWWGVPPIPLDPRSKWDIPAAEPIPLSEADTPKWDMVCRWQHSPKRSWRLAPPAFGSSAKARTCFLPAFMQLVCIHIFFKVNSHKLRIHSLYIYTKLCACCKHLQCFSKPIAFLSLDMLLHNEKENLYGKKGEHTGYLGYFEENKLTSPAHRVCCVAQHPTKHRTVSHEDESPSDIPRFKPKTMVLCPRKVANSIWEICQYGVA